MKTSTFFSAVLPALACLVAACDAFSEENPIPEGSVTELTDVARMLSRVQLTAENLTEVHEAVRQSTANGYDEEYMMKNLYLDPGSGVGDEIASTKAAVSRYADPIRSKISEELLSELAGTDVQIYWPYSDGWDGETYPIITFDPCSDTGTNIGYELVTAEDGSQSIEEVVVDEATARNRPVWVINRNDDSGFRTLESLRKENPAWGEGGDIIVRSTVDGDVGRTEAASARAAGISGEVKGAAGSEGPKTLVLKDFTMKRQYDSWFAGASEFFVKCGAVENFTASTEAEMRTYLPAVTDFMIVVKRSEMGEKVPFNAILVSNLTDQVEEFAFMITEDDGGTNTSWKCETTVKVNSKVYGITMDLPFRTKDDIVWRGTLSTRFLDAYAGKSQHFGDVDLTFDYL